jgi:hypothetical protein
MTNAYSDRLHAQLAGYARAELANLDDGISSAGDPLAPHPHSLSPDAYKANILPGIRDAFWSWFEALEPRIKLQATFHDLSSSQAVAFNLFFPFLQDGRVDQRLLDVLGVRGRDYTGTFEKVLDEEEGACFDFYLEAHSGARIFVDLKLAEAHFGRCEADAGHIQKLERHYRPDLHDHVDAKWLEPQAFFGNHRVMRNLSYLGRHPGSGAVFIFPRVNACLKDEEQAIKQIVSKSLAPRVAILYLEYLVERILTATASDPALHEHFLRFRAKYICL